MGYYQIEHDGFTRTVEVSGRDEWALLRLIERGKKGCTPIDEPAPRWSAYVHKLRGMGFDIETVHERHGGQFPGRHARYVLHSNVKAMEVGNG